MILPDEAEEQAVADMEDDAVAYCLAACILFRKAKRKEGSNYARKQLKKQIEEEEDSPLRELYEHAVKLPKECCPVNEADQTSSFILCLLRPVFDRPDVNRLAHMATTPSSSNTFVRLCNNMSALSKNPDILVRCQERLDIGVAEVSSEPSATKDIGDLCRIALWSKRLLDELMTKFDGVRDIKLIFFQVVDQTCVFYTMIRAETVCVAMEFARLKIAYSISDLLMTFEDDARDWLMICCNFESLVTTLKSAKERTSDTPRLPVFYGLSALGSRHMKKDARRNP